MRSHSEYWRRNRSASEATELALVLRALRKVAGHVGRNVRPLYWAGMVEPDISAMVLDPSPIRGKYPVAGKDFDVLAGRVVREGLSSLEWGDWVRRQALSGAAELPPERAGFVESLLEAAEDIYLSLRSRGQIWEMYLDRLWEAGGEARDPSLPPSPESMAALWRQRALYGRLPENLHFYHGDLWPILDRVFHDLERIVTRPTVASRRESRAFVYRGMRERVEEVLREWERFAPADDAENLYDEAASPDELPDVDDSPPEEREPPEDEEDDPRPPESGELDPDLAEEVAGLMEDEDRDLTRNMAVAVRDPEAGHMETVFRIGRARTTVLPDPIQVRRLKNVFREQDALARKAKNRRVRRGLQGGRLDARRLYRVPIDGRAFKHRQAPDTDHGWRICIVADASASMSGRPGEIKPWSAAEKTFVSLAEAARGSRNLVDIFAYNEDRKVCQLTRLYHGGELYSVAPAGRTPSGQAILAAATLLGTKLRRSMIIHITDGAANCGLRMGDATGYCDKKGIDVYTIGCGCNQQTRDFLRACFPPDRIFFMRDITRLAAGLERLFRGTILQGIR
ncbi:MAG: vWA domain-containing protein [Desulfatibacillaceae bacterium]